MSGIRSELGGMAGLAQNIALSELPFAQHAPVGPCAGSAPRALSPS